MRLHRHVFLALLAAGCGAASPTEPARTDPAPRQAPLKNDLPAPRPTAKKVEPAPPTTAKEPATFKSDWLVAQDLLDAKADRWKPAAEDSKRLLTRDERIKAEGLLKLFGRDAGQLSSREAAELMRLGFGDAVRYFSSQAARQDKTFLTVAEAVWTPSLGPAGLAELAERWRLVSDIHRPAAARAILANLTANNMDATTRDVILELGLRDWLSR